MIWISFLKYGLSDRPIGNLRYVWMPTLTTNAYELKSFQIKQSHSSQIRPNLNLSDAIQFFFAEDSIDKETDFLI